MKKQWLIILIAVLYSFVFNGIYGQATRSFSVGNITAEAGSMVSGYLDVPDGTDSGTVIPVTIINGSGSGPVLSLIAGQHGTEYVPVIVLQQLMREINPGKLSGTLIMVNIANVPSFRAHLPYYNPVDWRNPNRQYPGITDGSLTQRIAYIITTEIIDKSEYLIDLHGAEFDEDIVNIVYYYYDCPVKSLCEGSLLMATAFGGDYIEPNPYYLVPDSVKYSYCDLSAMRRGIPAIVVESGGRGVVDPEKVRYMKNGIFNVMDTLKMLNGVREKTKNPTFVFPEEVVLCDTNGIYYRKANLGQYVNKGSLLAFVTDYFGNQIAEFRAPISGIILAIFVAPSISKRDVVCYIAAPKD